MSVSEAYDVIIVGGGSAGFAAALEAERHKRRVLMLNAGLPMGGTCVNVGCVPSKYLIHQAWLYHVRNGSDGAFSFVFGEDASCCGRSSVEGASVHVGLGQASSQRQDGRAPQAWMRSLQAGRKQLVESLRKAKYEHVLERLRNTTCLPVRARFVDAHTVETEDGKRWQAPIVIVATGASPQVPPLRGLERVPYHTSQSLLELEEVPRHLIVLGAGFVGLELAQAYRRLGASVTVVDIAEKQLLGLSEEATEVLVGALTAEGIRFLLGMRVEEVCLSDNGEILLEGRYQGRQEVVRGTHLLVATGRKPNTEGLNLEAAGIATLPSGHIRVNEYLQTSQPHIYAVGDCNQLAPLVYTAAYEGKVAVRNAFTCCDAERIAVNYDALPVVVFTDPQVAWCGLTRIPPEKQDEYDEVVLTPSDIPACVVRGTTRGILRLIRHRRTDRLVGAELVMAHAGEVIGYVALAIRFGLTVSQLRDTLLPYLTFSEAIRLGSIAFQEDVGRLSCCAF